MDLFKLQSLKVKYDDEGEHDYRIAAESILPPPIACYKCGCVANLDRWGRKEQAFLDRPFHYKPTVVTVDRQRYRCKECGATFFEELPDMDIKRMATKRLIKYIEDECWKNTFTDIATKTGFDEKTIRNIFAEFSKGIEENLKFKTPRWLGMDEAHLLHNMRCVITDIENHTLFDILRNRNKPTVIKYLRNLPDKDKIEYVTMDMWSPYRDACYEVIPHATVIIDKFHVTQMAQKTLEKCRLVIRKTLSDKERKDMLHDRFILRKRPQNLKNFEHLKLDYWLERYPDLKATYHLKEDVFKFYEASCREEAEDNYREWVASIPTEFLPHYDEILTSFRNWNTEIFNYYNSSEKRLTNAYTESVNGLIKMANREGRGYSFDVLRTKMLLTAGVKRAEKYKVEKYPAGIDAETYNALKILIGEFPTLSTESDN